MRRTRIGQCGTGSRRNYGKHAAHVWDFVFLLARHSSMMDRGVLNVDEVILPSFKDTANEGISPRVVLSYARFSLQVMLT